jgi:hypothetical protein
MASSPPHSGRSAPSPVGAYGLRLSGVDEAASILSPAAPDWPAVALRVTVGDHPATEEYIDGDRATIRLRTGGSVELDRKAGRARYTVPAPLSADELVHPFLAPTASVFAYWHRRESLHAGGVALADRAWGLVGERLGGKSSLLAALALSGLDIVCDDVLVVDGREAFVGPRTIDLREDAADAFGVGREIGVVGTRQRWRIGLRQLDRRLVVSGWIFTAWSDECRIQRVPVAQTLARLLRNRSTRLPPQDPAMFLGLSALPAWELRRPRSWETMPEALELMLGVLREG